jgi:hypothetical protein
VTAPTAPAAAAPAPYVSNYVKAGEWAGVAEDEARSGLERATAGDLAQVYAALAIVDAITEHGQDLIQEVRNR